MVDFTGLVIASAVLIPIVTGVVQAIKNAGMNTFYAPLVSIVLGVGAEFLATGTIVDSPSIGITVLLGLIVGLSASGLYSGTQRLGEGNK